MLLFLLSCVAGSSPLSRSSMSLTLVLLCSMSNRYGGYQKFWSIQIVNSRYVPSIYRQVSFCLDYTESRCNLDIASCGLIFDTQFLVLEIRITSIHVRRILMSLLIHCFCKSPLKNLIFCCYYMILITLFVPMIIYSG